MLDIERRNHFSESSEVRQEEFPEEQSKSNIMKFAKTFQIFDQVLKQEVISYQPQKLSNLPTFESTAKQMCS